MNDDPIEIAIFFNKFEADIAKSKLDAFEVFCFLEDDSVLATDWFGTSANSKLKLFVRVEDAERAKGILNDEVS